MLNIFKNSQDLYKNKPWLRFLVLGNLGTMVLAVCFLLLGCGSDNKPGAVSNKKEKAAASTKAMKSQAALPLMNRSDESRGAVKRAPLPPDKVLAPGLTAGEVEARMEATRKLVEAPDYKVFPGITKQELDEKIAAEQIRQESAKSASQEILPGITKQELEARLEAHAKRTAMSGNEGLKGITKEELNARLEADRIKRGMTNEVLPGVFKGELEGKLRQTGKQ